MSETPLRVYGICRMVVALIPFHSSTTTNRFLVAAALLSSRISPVIGYKRYVVIPANAIDYQSVCLSVFLSVCDARKLRPNDILFSGNLSMVR